MPQRRLSDYAPAATGGPRRRRLSDYGDDSGTVALGAEPSQPDSDEGIGLGTALAGAAGLAGVALLTRQPGTLGKIGSFLKNTRLASMLSGFAPLKSTLGNVGAAGIASAERSSMAPLRELLSMETVRDVGRNIKAGGGYGQLEAAPWYSPARYMSAMDSATSSALERAGLSSDEAQRYLLQSPLPERIAKPLESKAAQYLVPFRRTPVNQFLEGFDTLSGKHPRVLAGAVGAGAAVGGGTDAEPWQIGMTAPLTSTYALPYLLGAVAGRKFLRGKTTSEASQVAGGIAPFSDYGLTQGVLDPLGPYTNPAALRALRRLYGR